MSDCCFLLFNYLDFFRFPLTFSLNKREKMSTSIGKWMTIGIIAFLLYSLTQSDLVNKKNPMTYSQDSIKPNRPSFWFSKENFTLVFGVGDGNNNFLNDQTIFSILFYTYSVNNTNHDANVTQVVLQPCTQEDFMENSEEFNRLGLQGAFCLPSTILKLSGYWDEPQIEYLDFELVTCRNSSDSPIICQPQEVITSILSNYYVDVYITNYFIDVSNYLAPFSRNLEVYFKQIDFNLFKSMNIYLQPSFVDTDDGFFFESWNIQQKVIVEEVDFDVESNAQKRPYFFEVSIYVGNLESKIIRNYQKIQTLLAQLGGICNFLFFLGFFISKAENNYRMNSFLGNELFIFPKIVEGKKNIKRSADSIMPAKNTMEMSKSSRSSPKKLLSVRERIKNVLSSSLRFKNNLEEKNEENLECYQKIKNRENFFTIGFWGFVKLILKFHRFFLTTKERLYLRSKEQISEQMDILKIMKKVQEIDKLKRILLSEEQLYLFNLVSKPMVILEKSRDTQKLFFMDKRFKFDASEKPNLERERLKKNYESVNAHVENSEVDKRLLKLIDEDVMCFLKNEMCSD